ncbi:hypothetical protein TH63_04945 [Rufibacter radiotolerans]|uniref:YD repeat-containing protein n=1 Tax=Rufibacter radiotolerans TaxID=1379910 RepID=A0A0H4VID9_9BACT|nr:hypothetical protein TH63_04945 [Rufibacter radiotolerans]
MKEQITFPAPGESLTRTITFDGDRVTQISDVLQGQRPTTSTVVYGYNVKGEVISTTLVDPQGLPLEAFAFEHDANGLVKKVDWYNKKQNPGSPQLALYATKEYTYTDKKLINVKNWLVTGSPRLLLNDFNFTYDAKGNVTQVHEYRVLGYIDNNPDNYNDIVINVTYTYDDKMNPYKESWYMKYLPTGLFIPGLSQNNIVATTSATTLEGTKKGPGANFNTNMYNFTNTTTYAYTDKGRPNTATYSGGSVRTFTYKCE